MRMMIDSHVFLWLDSGEFGRIPLRTQRLLASAGFVPVLSYASVWELSLKISTGKLALVRPLTAMLATYQSTKSLAFLPITLPHIHAQQALPRHHGDPFDRMIIAQSLVESVPIASADAMFDRYGVTRIWE